MTEPATVHAFPTADELEPPGDEIAELAAHIDAANVLQPRPGTVAVSTTYLELRPRRVRTCAALKELVLR